MKDNKSVDRVLKILEYISKNPQGVTLSEIHKELGIAKTTVFDYLEALYKSDAVYYKDENLKTYVIGSKIYAIGQAYTKNSSLISVCKPYIKRLSDKYGALWVITKRVGKNIVYVHKLNTVDDLNATPEIGSSISYYHNNSIGKCYLAFDSLFELPKNYDFELTTPYTKMSTSELMNSINQTKNQGYVVDIQEERLGYESISFPIYNFENRCCGALTMISSIKFFYTFEFIEDIKKSSLEISYKLGYRINGGKK